MINNTLIEALVSPGLRRKPEFVWDAKANDLKTIIGHIAEGHARLPPIGADPTKLNAGIGLAFAVANVFDRSDKSVWDQSELRRVATIAMQMGYEVSALASYLPHTQSYLEAYLEEQVVMNVAEADQRSIQVMCFAAVLVANLKLDGKGQSDFLNKAEALLNCFAEAPHHQQKINQIQSMAVEQECRAQTTAEFARIAQTLFIQAGRTYDPQPDDEDSAQKSPQDQQPQAQEHAQQQPKSDGDQGGEGAGDEAQPDGGDSGSKESGEAQAEQSNACDQAQDNTQGQASEAGNQGADGSESKPNQAAQAAQGEDEGSGNQECGGNHDEESRLEVHDGEAQASAQNADVQADPQESAPAELVQAALQSEQSGEGEDAELVMFGDGAGGDAIGDHLPVRNKQLNEHVDGQLITAIVNTFQDSRTRYTGLRTVGSKVDVKRVWRVRLGDMRVFRTRQDSPGMDMAMSVLVDRSQSMHACLKEVCGIALAFSVGLGRITGTKCRIAAFPGYSAATTVTVLDYGENHKAAQDRLERLHASGSTPLAQAIVFEARKLVERNEHRKVITVLTDGKPDNGDEVRAAIRWAEGQGVEVVGIGFASAHKIQQWIKNSVFAQSVEQLPAAIQGIFREKILEAA